MDDDQKHLIDHNRRLQKEMQEDPEKRDQVAEKLMMAHILEHENQIQHKHLVAALVQRIQMQQQMMNQQQQPGQPGPGAPGPGGPGGPGGVPGGGVAPPGQLIPPDTQALTPGAPAPQPQA